MYTQYLGGKHNNNNKEGFGLGNVQARHVDKVTYPELFEALKKPHQQQELQGLVNNNQDEPEKPTYQNSLLLNTSADESARYFVRLPGQAGLDGQGNVLLDDSSMSTISTNSQYSKHNQKI
jgi:hypothetical protein